MGSSSLVTFAFLCLQAFARDPSLGTFAWELLPGSLGVSLWKFRLSNLIWGLYLAWELLLLCSSLGTVVLGFSFDDLHLRAVAWELSLRNCRLETLAPVVSLGNSRSGTFVSGMALGNVRLGTFVQAVSFRNFRVGSFARERWLENFHLEILALKL